MGRKDVVGSSSRGSPLRPTQPADFPSHPGRSGAIFGLHAGRGGGAEGKPILI